MKRIILLVCFVLCFGAVAFAQETVKKEAPAQIGVEANYQAQVTIAQQEIEKAEQALLLARLVRQNLILKLRLLLGVPNDYVEGTDEKGNLIFVKPKMEKPKE